VVQSGPYRVRQRKSLQGCDFVLVFAQLSHEQGATPTHQSQQGKEDRHHQLETWVL
jgi:hypothetical protein